MLIQIDGPGTPEFVTEVTHRLRDLDPSGWTVIRFDAWQYQRVAPPWWWLITAIDQQLHDQLRRRPWRRRYNRCRDYAWRSWQLIQDLVPVCPLVVIAAGLWYLAGQLDMDRQEVAKSAAGVAGGLASLGAVLWSGTKALRRLLVTSPLGASAAMRTSDPMADLQRRYSFLIRSAGKPVAVVIDNLDRCRASYVVELLEGIQTLLKSPRASMKPTAVVAFLVPGSRRWLCDSYLDVYKEFQQSSREPGRPFGLSFLDKVFDVSLQLPLVPPATSLTAPLPEQMARVRRIEASIDEANSEHEIRRLLGRAERGPAGDVDAQLLPPVPQLRLAAVSRLGRLEPRLRGHLCPDTKDQLDELVDAVGAGSTVVRRLRTAYCVQRTAQLLGGHEIDDRDDAVHQLGLWTILGIRWPLLVQHLVENPHHIEHLRRRTSPPGVDADLVSLFEGVEACQIAFAWPNARLEVDDVRRFAIPLTACRRRDTSDIATQPPPAAAAIAR